MNHLSIFDYAKFIITKDLVVYRKSIIILLTPILLLPLILAKNDYKMESTCAYVVILMAVYWVTEALPLPVTSFLPIFLFPVLGILPAKDTCANYLKDANFLFVGGLIMALATEESQLHKRIALAVLLKMGSEPKWLMLGFMITAAFLSMWMSNVATTAMMVPIAISVLQELVAHHASSNDWPPLQPKRSYDSNEMQDRKRSTARLIPSDKSQSNILPTLDETEPLEIIVDDPRVKFDNDSEFDGGDVEVKKCPVIPKETNDSYLDYDFESLPKDLRGTCKAIMLSICVSANLGGTGTLTGTGPNIILSGQLNQFYPNQTDVTYASWLLFGLPPMVICLILAWLCLQITFKGWKSVFRNARDSKLKSADDGIRNVLLQKYEQLGKISFAEISVSIWFLILIFLWIFREPLFTPGWQQWLKIKTGYTSDACASMFISCILFAWPNQLPDLICFRKAKDLKPLQRSSLVTWSIFQKKFPWGVVLLLGGGYAMADGVKASKLDLLIGCLIRRLFGHLSPMVICFAVVVIITFVTEIASNSATATIFIPVLLSVAQVLRINPLYFVLPATVACSFAFMLPVATPPNAVIFESKMITIKEMVTVGFILNILCIAVTTLNMNTYAYYLFNLGQYPFWALSGPVRNSTMNSTLLC